LARSAVVLELLGWSQLLLGLSQLQRSAVVLGLPTKLHSNNASLLAT
jgi:hypothetical protein